MDTRQQKIAQCLDRHLAVTANAGSGKTRVLVNRYINILLDYLSNPDYDDHIKPKNIVAITFTKKAAAEMLAKVIAKIESLIIEEKSLPKLEELKTIREQLTNARISTIHSFCSELLREFPIEAQVSPNFIEINDAQNLILHKEAIISLLEDLLRSDENLDFREKVSDLISDFGRKNLQDLLLELSSNPYLVEKLIDFYKLNNKDILLKRNELFYEIFWEPINFYSRLIEKIIIDNIDNSKKSKNQDKVNYITSLFKDLYDLLSNNDRSIENIVKIISVFCSVCELIFNSNGELKYIIRKDPSIDNIEITLEKAGELYLDLINALDIFQFLNYDEKAIDNSRIVLALVQEVLKYCDEEKEYIGALDFEDLLVKTNKLLNNNEVVKKIKERIKYLLVDEFQDTNDIQYEIIKKLVPELNTKNYNASGINLFIVGDEKQSIYGFRNANVRIFKKIKKEIIELNENGLKKFSFNDFFKLNNELIKAHSEQEILGNHILSVSFRLKPAIASFVNTICSNIMQEDKLGYEFEYEPLICTRDFDFIENNQKDLVDNENLLSRIGTITFIQNIIPYKGQNFIEGGTNFNDDNFEDELDNEAELLAKQVKNIIENSDGIYNIEASGVIKNPEYRDIAVLARRKKRFYALIQAFIKYNIPFIVHSGLNIFDSYEINDLLELLNFIRNNKDDSALIATLRSSLFGLNDTEIYTIFSEEGKFSFWEKLESYVLKIKNNLNEESKPERAYRIINEILNIATSISFSELIIYILDITGWYGTIFGSEKRIQIESDVKKLVDFARELFESGYKGFYDLVDELNFIRENAIADREQVTISSENVVNVMTIHASKGLEFPIVFIFDTNLRLTNNKSYFYNEKLGLSFDVSVTDEDKNSFNCSTPIKFLSSYLSKLDQQAEEKRLLYVAMTRAKDHLIITTTFQKNKDDTIRKTSGIISSILEGLKLTPLDIINKSSKKFSKNKLKFWKDNNECEFEFPLIIYLVNTIDLPLIENEVKKEELICPNIFIENIESKVSAGFYSASRLTSYTNDKNNYYKSYILGLPKEFDYYYTNLKQDTGDKATIIGDIVHRVFEQLTHWLGADGSVIIDKLHQTIENSIVQFKAVLSKESKERIFNEIIDVSNTNFFKANVNHLLNAQSEKLLMMPLGSGFLKGVIDLLVQNQMNEWEVWDWKTNKISNDNDVELLAYYYKPQMQFYAYMLSKLYPSQNKYDSLLLFTNCASRFDKNDKWYYRFSWQNEELSLYESYLLKTISEIPY